MIFKMVTGSDPIKLGVELNEFMKKKEESGYTVADWGVLKANGSVYVFVWMSKHPSDGLKNGYKALKRGE